jgi:hypothetical protein
VYGVNSTASSDTILVTVVDGERFQDKYYTFVKGKNRNDLSAEFQKEERCTCH